VTSVISVVKPFFGCGYAALWNPMARNLTALRSQIESVLARRIPAPFTSCDSEAAETVSAGIPATDGLTGGLPRGGITEICGPSCSGRTSLLMAALASRTDAAEACACIDGRDAFDPYSAEAAGVQLNQLLWVRCRNIDQALRATDLVLHAGGFGLVALDLGDIPPEVVRYVPLNVWFRFRRAVEHTPTNFLVIEQEPHAKTCASLVLRMETEAAHWLKTTPDGQEVIRPSHACLFAGSLLRAEVLRNRGTAEWSPMQSVGRACFDRGSASVTLESEYHQTLPVSFRAQRGISLCARVDQELDLDYGLCGTNNQSKIPRCARNDTVAGVSGERAALKRTSR